MIKVKIVDSLENMTEGTKQIEVFDKDRYIRDFEKLLNEDLVEYDITYVLDLKNEPTVRWYPYILGDIDDIDKKKLIELLDDDPYITYFADNDYFSLK